MIILLLLVCKIFYVYICDSVILVVLQLFIFNVKT